MELVLFAEDDDTYEARKPSGNDVTRWTLQQQHSDNDERKEEKEEERVASEHILLIGWRDRMFEMMSDLDACIGKGSTVTILCQLPLKERVASLERSSFLKNGTVPPPAPALDKLRGLLCEHHDNAAVSKKLVLELEAAEKAECDRFGFQNIVQIEHVVESPVLRCNLDMIQLERFDVVLILADESARYFGNKITSVAKDKDSQSVATLLLTRDIRSELNLKKPLPILAEILDSHTKHLLASHSQQDCVTSNELISKAMAMISERSEVAEILDELLTDVGNEFYVYPATRYCKVGEKASFWDLCARALSRRDILIGYIDAKAPNSPVLNPEDKREVRTWARGDKLVLIHE